MRRLHLSILHSLLAVCLFTPGLNSHSANAASTAPVPGSPLNAGQVFSDCAGCPDVVVIPAGSFVMGSSPEERRREGVPAAFANREQPQHTVSFAKPFGLGRTEVTVAQYAVFAAETSQPGSDDCMGYDRAKDNWGLLKGSWRDPGFEQSDNDPVVCISFHDATAYAAWLARKTGKRYRLASEAEWEYAARAGTATARYWDDSPRTLCEHANVMNSATFADLGSPASWQGKLICTARDSWSMPVASFAANPFGLYDMVGSVWEWIADCAHDDYVGAPTDGSAWESSNCGRYMVRGGAFHSEFWLARSATRSAGLDPAGRPVASGIRVARDLDP